MDKKIQIIFNRSELTAGTRGASLGPEAMMAVARKRNNFLFGNYPVDYVEDYNYLLDQPVKYPFAKRVEGLSKVFDCIANKVKNVLQNGGFPFVLAGDHGSAGGTIAGVKAAFPTKRLGVVWIDAHGDLHTPYTTPSGNMHGMPLATALGVDNLEEKVNDVSDDVRNVWEKLKNTGVAGAKINPEDLVFIAVRDLEAQEKALMERYQIVNHTVDEIRQKGMDVVMKEIQHQLSDCDILYISFDVDSMDPKHTSYGTGTPVDHGLLPEEAAFFLEAFARESKTVCMEFVEVNPCLDEQKNKMAEVAFELMDQTINVLEQ